MFTRSCVRRVCVWCVHTAARLTLWTRREFQLETSGYFWRHARRRSGRVVWQEVSDEMWPHRPAEHCSNFWNSQNILLVQAYFWPRHCYWCMLHFTISLNLEQHFIVSVLDHCAIWSGVNLEWSLKLKLWNSKCSIVRFIPHVCVFGPKLSALCHK